MLCIFMCLRGGNFHLVLILLLKRLCVCVCMCVHLHRYYCCCYCQCFFLLVSSPVSSLSLPHATRKTNDVEVSERVPQQILINNRKQKLKSREYQWKATSMQLTNKCGGLSYYLFFWFSAVPLLLIMMPLLPPDFAYELRQLPGRNIIRVS